MMDLIVNSSASRTANHGCSGCAALQGDALAHPSGVAELGGSASIAEIVETAIEREGSSDAQQDKPATSATPTAVSAFMRIQSM
jgi:hypothetical protein